MSRNVITHIRCEVANVVVASALDAGRLVFLFVDVALIRSRAASAIASSSSSVGRRRSGTSTCSPSAARTDW
ncbi:hypothetical protein [Pengzhenrongella sp.]|jgi:hypothetical protein|uniref:hypothetical protein n=1 Tax=Pengzhenrongella sp. TaxID=2888820 RepID=UPI002F938E70